MSERIVCVCGRVWLVQRFVLAETCSDEAICLCGQTLKHWNEPADYIFEPVEAVVPAPLKIPSFLRESWPRVRAAEVHRRASRER
jgi:hypothetical protein